MLSPETLNLLTNEQKSTAADMEALFASNGWKFLQEWIKTNIELATNRCLNAANWDTYLYSRAQRSEFDRWQNLEAAFEAEYTNLAELAREDALESVVEDEPE